MNLFTSRNGIITAEAFSKSLEPFGLRGKHVLVYSRLLSLGRFTGKEAVTTFLSILREHIGESGTLVIPTYTLNSYKEPRLFDFEKSKIMSGVLGEFASKDPSFKRTIHPVYSNCIAGKATDQLLEQDITTCFGENSFFDLFAQLDNAFVMMIGLNFNGPTFYHYYDQKYKAKGRLLKDFAIKMKVHDVSFNMRFNSYVKDHVYYAHRVNCLARFDALTEQFNVVKRIHAGDDHIHMISEKDFRQFYKAALTVNQEYFLMAAPEVWEKYYLENKFDLLHNDMDEDLLTQIRSEISL